MFGSSRWLSQRFVFFSVLFFAVNERTTLVELCTGRYAERGKKERSLAECFKGMLVGDLRGFTEEKLMAFVERKKGPDGRVPAWLLEHGLESFLRDEQANSEDALFPAPAAPSSIQEEDLRPRFCMSSVVARGDFVELLRVLKEPCADDGAINDAKELVSILHRLCGQDKEHTIQVSRHELFTNDSGCAKLELAFSSVISDFFSWRLGKLRSFHQMPARRGTSDILLCHRGDVSGQYHPVCVIECGMHAKSDADMRKSLRSYAVNYCPIVPLRQYFLGVEWLKVDSALRAQLRVKAFYRVPNDARVHEVMLWNQDNETELAEMLARVMCAIRLADEHNHPSADRMRARWRVLSRNVAVDMDRQLVFKSFDYRDRWDQIAEGYRREPGASCRWMTGCEIVAQQKDFALLQYPFLNGTSIAQRASDFIPVFKELADLHQEGLVHGDIRAHNMIFVEGSGGKLIDFDYSGKHAERCYPPGYWRDLDDTRRHDRAVAEEQMRKEHDCFSLGAVMAMYRCDHAGWSQLAEKLQTGRPDVGALIGELEQLGDSKLEWIGTETMFTLANGLPEKNQTLSPTKP